MKEVVLKLSDVDYHKLLIQCVYDGRIKTDTCIKITEIMFTEAIEPRIDSIRGELN